MYSQYSQGTPGGYSQYYNRYNQGLLRTPQRQLSYHPAYQQPSYSMPDVSGQSLAQSVSGLGGPVGAATGGGVSESSQGLPSHGNVTGRDVQGFLTDAGTLLSMVGVNQQSVPTLTAGLMANKAGKTVGTIQDINEKNYWGPVQAVVSSVNPMAGFGLAAGRGLVSSYQAGLLGDMLDSRTNEGLLDAYEQFLADNNPFGFTDYEEAAALAAANADRDALEYEGYDPGWGGTQDSPVDSYGTDTYDLDYGSPNDGMDGAEGFSGDDSAEG